MYTLSRCFGGKKTIIVGKCATGKTVIGRSLQTQFEDKGVVSFFESENICDKHTLKTLLMKKGTVLMTAQGTDNIAPVYRANADFWIITSKIPVDSETGKYFPKEVVEASQQLTLGKYLLYWTLPEEAFMPFETSQIPGTYQVLVTSRGPTQFTRKLPERCTCFDRKLPDGYHVMSHFTPSRGYKIEKESATCRKDKLTPWSFLRA